MFKNARIKREKKTVALMIELYCQAHHSSKDKLCQDCVDLRQYATERTDNCRFGNQKPVCVKCPVHCYKNGMRDEIIKVMRYSGPRMMFMFPLLAAAHILDKMMYKNNTSLTGHS